jgi:hypothetical protein
MNYQLKYWVLPLGFAFVIGCDQRHEKPAADRVHEVLADSSSRAMVVQSICSDHQMSMEMMKRMMMQAKTDTSMCNDMCKMMMADSSMMCKMQMKMPMGSAMGGSSMGGSCDMSSSTKAKDGKAPDESAHHPASKSMKMKM